MTKGDSLILAFKIKEGEDYIDGSTYDEVELQFNKQSSIYSVKKTMSEGQITWNDDDFCFECELSQDDTYNLVDGINELQVRLVKDGVIATIIKPYLVKEALSSNVIGGQNA